MSSTPNRKRLTLDQKKLIVQIKEDNMGLSYGEVAEEFYKRTKLTVSESSVCMFWKHRDHIKKGIPYSTRQPIDVSISEETILKVEEAEKQDKQVTESDVIEFAQKVVRENKLEPSQYFFSPEWARGILRGKRDDVGIRMKQDNSPKKMEEKPLPTTSAVEGPEAEATRLLYPSPNQNIVYIEENGQDILNSSRVVTDTSDLVLNYQQSENQPKTNKSKRKSEVVKEKRVVAKRKASKVSPPPSPATPTKRVKVKEDVEIPSEEPISLKGLLISKSNGHDYRSILYSLLEEAYRDSPYFAVGMEKELDSIKKTLQFMVEKEGYTW